MSYVSPSAPPDAVPAALPRERADPGDDCIRRAERQLRLLEELGEIGMILARSLKDRALAQAEGERPADPPDEVRAPAARPAREPADAFCSLSRAIRLTFVLEARTAADLSKMHDGVFVEGETRRKQSVRRAEAAREERDTARRDRVRDLLWEVVERDTPDIERCHTLQAALDQRLEEDEAYLNIADLPLRETLERLCADVCFEPDWSRWAGEDWGPPEPFRRLPASPFAQASPMPIGWEDLTPEERRKRLGIESLFDPPPPHSHSMVPGGLLVTS